MLKLSIHTLIISGLLAMGTISMAGDVRLEDRSATEKTQLDQATEDAVHAAAIGEGNLPSDVMNKAIDAASGVVQGVRVKLAISETLKNISVLDGLKSADAQHLAGLVSQSPIKPLVVKNILSGVAKTTENTDAAINMLRYFSVLPDSEVNKVVVKDFREFFNKYGANAMPGFAKGLKYASVVAADRFLRHQSVELKGTLDEGLTLMYMNVHHEDRAAASKEAKDTDICWL